MRSKTLKEEAISTEMRQPFRLPKLRNAGFGSYLLTSKSKHTGEEMVKSISFLERGRL
jgi:hypothetical protein